MFQVGVFFGGLPMETNVQTLKNNCPHIVVGTPGRILALIKAKKLSLKNVKQFILDECDKMLEALGKLYIKIMLIDNEYLILIYIIFFNQICVEMCRKSSATHPTKNKL
jgi:hypothetical protein